jgi:hypothetical protein
MVIQLEVVSDDEHPADVADIGEVSRELVDELRKKEYIVSPAYTGKKGGSVFDIVLQMSQFICDNKELLAPLFESITLTLQCLFMVHNQRAERERERRALLEFRLELDGNPITITVHNVKDAVELLKCFQEIYPEAAKKLTPASSIKVKAKVSKKRRRHSH